MTLGKQQFLFISDITNYVNSFLIIVYVLKGFIPQNLKDHALQNCSKLDATKSQTTEPPPTEGSTEVNQAPPTDPSGWLAVLLDAVKTDLVSTQQAFGRI